MASDTATIDHNRIGSARASDFVTVTYGRSNGERLCNALADLRAYAARVGLDFDRAANIAATRVTWNDRG